MSSQSIPTSDPSGPPPFGLSGTVRRRRTASSTVVSASLTSRLPEQTIFNGKDAAFKQIELLTGSRDTVIRVAAIRKHGGAFEREGTIGELLAWLIAKAEEGHNCYVRAQPTRALPDDAKATDADVTGMRAGYADGDGQTMPEAWHLPPTYVLEHAQSGNWWAVWAIAGGTREDIRPTNARIAHRYCTDAKVVNESRLIRLAGLPRWKENKITKAWERSAAYTLRVMSGERSDLWMHDALPELPAREVHTGTLDAPDVISERRLRDLLAFIHPFDRSDWLRVGFAMRDATVLNAHLERLDQTDLIMLFDDWASGALWQDHAGPKLNRVDVGAYEGPSDSEALFNGKRSTEGKVMLGSVVHLARSHAVAQGLQVSASACRPGALELFKAVAQPVPQATPIDGAQPAAQPVAAEPLDDLLVLFPTAPLESAEEMLRRRFTHCGRTTLVRDNGEFYTWNGQCFSPFSDERLNAEVSKFLRGAYRKNKDGELVPFNPTRATIAEVVAALTTLTHTPEGAEAPCWLDGRAGPAPPHILACRNGLLDMSSREMLEHTPAYFSANVLDFAYEATASRPVHWLKFLSDIAGDDHEVADTLQEIFGLMLTNDTSLQKAFMIVGPPRSGKGTIARMLTALLGKANICAPTLSDLSQSFGLASLIGKRAAIISDAQLGGRANQDAIVERLLAVTGEDTVNVARKYQTDWTGRLVARFLVMTNEIPQLSNASGALPNRFVMLMLKHSFLGKEDTKLTERLMGELPGILNWSLEGLARLRQRGHFQQPASSSDMIREMEHAGSPVMQFVREECDLAPGATEPCEDTYARYRVSCERQGVKPDSQPHFARKLFAAFPDLKKLRPGGRGAQKWAYHGIGKRSPTPVADAPDTIVPFSRRRTRPLVEAKQMEGAMG